MKKLTLYISLFIVSVTVLITLVFVHSDAPRDSRSFVGNKAQSAQSEAISREESISSINFSHDLESETDATRVAYSTRKNSSKRSREKQVLKICPDFNWNDYSGEELHLTDSELLELKDYNVLGDADVKLAELIVNYRLGPSGQIEELRSLLNANPKNELIAWVLMKLCSKKNSNCNSNEIKKITEDFGGNGAIWREAASYYLSTKKTKEAYLAMRNIIDSESYNTFRVEVYEILESYYADVLDVRRKRLLVSDNYQYIDESENRILSYCEGVSRHFTRTLERCIGVGDKIQKSTSIYSEQVFGQRILLSALAKSKDPNYDVIKAQFESNRLENIAYYKEVNNLMMYDDKLFERYFETLKKFGERNAIIEAIEEAKRLSKISNYDPCPES
ncbi:hypothetical protein FLL45_20265 [Aliikangiella marina]|uniref:Uncharacterized protein n=1 Tax=Aliikangiella marina TaxID=1712262 RepID=A0A545T2P2_9GAMM|nr:hypothetical protein [Aliikangiella marina]TQV71491.1 hypothetical protein FLL45_20265 [Aliikangiella marina]